MTWHHHSSIPTMQLDVGLRAYLPSWSPVSSPLPEQITLTNMDEARHATGLDWEPSTEPQYRRETMTGVPGAAVGFTEVSGYKYVTRGEGGPVLDSANSSYHVFRNAELFAVAEAIGVAGLQLGREVKFVAGGEINGGRRVFLLADLGARQIPGDPSPHVRYLGMVSSHDGSAALKVIGTDLRWFCTNAIHASELDAKNRGTAFSFRHTSRIAKRVEDATTAMSAAMYQLDQVDTMTEQLLAAPMSPRAMSEYIGQYALARVIGKADPARSDKAEGSHQRQKALTTVIDKLGALVAGPSCDGIRDTAYGALAATVEFLDHHRAATSDDARFSRTMLDTQPGKQLAVRILRSVR